MKKLNQNQEIAGRKISEILSRFDKKIRDPRSFTEGKKTAKTIREFLKISCPIDQMDKTLKSFSVIKLDLRLFLLSSLL